MTLLNDYHRSILEVKKKGEEGNIHQNIFLDCSLNTEENYSRGEHVGKQGTIGLICFSCTLLDHML